jgi:ceramide glucosyltransferase
MIYLILVAICLLTTLVSVVAVFWATSRRRRRTGHPDPEPVTVLKPLCGADHSLAANLETFFRLNHPDYELLFGVEGPDDPAIAVVEKLRERYPRVRCRLMIHDGRRGLNPKVSNLLAMLENTTHDVVVISDSNVAVDPDYLLDLQGQLQDDSGRRPVGLVTNLIAGVGEESLGAGLDSLHLAGPIAGSVAASQLWGRTFTVGKSMMFRRSVLAHLGGLESVATLLAEDYVIGRMFQSAGYAVRLGQQVVRNVCVRSSAYTFMRRYARWGLMRSRLAPWLYPLEILLNPLAIALAAPLFGYGFVIPLLAALALIAVRDGLQLNRLRGTRGLLPLLALGPLKELLTLLVWLAAPWKRSVSWRGKRYRVSAGTRLYTRRAMRSPDRNCEIILTDSRH